MEAILKDKVCLITGASRGIGKGIAQLFARQGGHIAFTFRSSLSSAQALEAELKQWGVKARGFQSDCSRYSEAEHVVNQVVEEFGSLDVLINNAGITKDGLLLRMTEAQWDEVINTNLKSVFALTKAAQKPMLSSKKGSIINISSYVGLRGNAGQSNYAASKAGILGFTKSIAMELGSRNIRCNAIAPGFIATEMTGNLNETTTQQWIQQIPLKRSGTVEDVAQACLFLASDLSSYITGQCLSVCGGMTT